VLVILGVLAADRASAEQAASAFARPFGGIAIWGKPVAFDCTDYYEAEMGPGLTRRFCCCADLLEPDRLVELKLRAWKIEQGLRDGPGRTVNLDPGTLDHGKVVLASFKRAPQKLYLGREIWADTLLFFQHGAFRPLPWTFPDLREGAHLDLLEQARKLYTATLRQGPPSPDRQPRR
jgi:hypothetical protein